MREDATQRLTAPDNQGADESKTLAITSITRI
jgi:hypothetical protein